MDNPLFTTPALCRAAGISPEKFRANGARDGLFTAEEINLGKSSSGGRAPWLWSLRQVRRIVLQRQLISTTRVGTRRARALALDWTDGTDDPDERVPGLPTFADGNGIVMRLTFRDRFKVPPMPDVAFLRATDEHEIAVAALMDNVTLVDLQKLCAEVDAALAAE